MLTDCLAFDTETHQTQPGIAAPPLVCASMSRWDPVTGKPVGFLFDKQRAIDMFLQAIADERITLAMAFAAYDMLVMAVAVAQERGIDIMPSIFAAYEAGRVFDILTAEALHHIAIGCLGKDPRTNKKLADPDSGQSKASYTLAVVHELVTGKVGAKAKDRFRRSYALLEPYPIETWPPEAREYPVDDTNNTLEDALAQAGLIPNAGTHEWISGPEGGTVCVRCEKYLEAGTSPVCRSVYPRKNLHDLATQAYTHWCMHLGAAWGLTPDPKAVALLKYEATKDLAEESKQFIRAGILEVCGDKITEKQNVLKLLVARAYGAKDPCTTCAKTVELAGRRKGEPAPGRVISPVTGRTLVNCPDCDGTGLQLISSVGRAEKGGICKSRDTLIESGDELLMSYGAFGEDKKIRTVYVPFMEEGIRPDLHLQEHELTPEGLQACLARIEAAGSSGIIPITLKPNVLLETNRTSYRDKTQTMPREGGVREGFKARDGFVYYSNDYGGIELATWAQICIWLLGYSDLAKALNNGINVHADFAASMAGNTYEQFMERLAAGDKLAALFRQAAKPGNFGLPGGMGELTLVLTQREQGPDTEHPTGPVLKKGKRVYRGLRFCLLIGGAQRCGERMIEKYNKKDCPRVCEKCVQCAKWLRETWEKKWSEAKPYFKLMNKVADQGFQVHPISKRIRGGIGYCDGANGFFQELAAQGAKDALRHVVREQYDYTYRPEDLHGERSVLYGNSRNIAFLHDELLGEARIQIAPEIAERVGVVMVRRMKRYVPDVKVTAEPTLMASWYKEAKCVRDANGRLLVWEPKR